jgi:hypothetical protein
MKGDDDYFEPEFKNLMEWMLSYIPSERLDLA